MDFEELLQVAHQAASFAQQGMKEGIGLDCGFAWVVISGNEPLARYCKAKQKAGGDSSLYGSKAYPIGWEFWKPGKWNGQSISVHEAGARAFRDVLAKHGISATVGSRLD